MLLHFPPFFLTLQRIILQHPTVTANLACHPDWLRSLSISDTRLVMFGRHLSQDCWSNDWINSWCIHVMTVLLGNGERQGLGLSWRKKATGIVSIRGWIFSCPLPEFGFTIERHIPLPYTPSLQSSAQVVRISTWTPPPPRLSHISPSPLWIFLRIPGPMIEKQLIFPHRWLTMTRVTLPWHTCCFLSLLLNLIPFSLCVLVSLCVALLTLCLGCCWLPV